MKLEGIRVLDLTQFLPGPHLTMTMADHGAEVIKVEAPHGGDPGREIGLSQDGETVFFRNTNRGKRSIRLDLKQEADRAVLLGLVDWADVLVESFRPGVADKLGFGADVARARNPRLVYCSITGMGADGPYAQRPSYDIVGQGLSGLLSQLVDVKDPRPMGPAFSDALTGLFASYGILAALQGRERTGRGQLVETSLAQATMAFMNEPYSGLFANGKVPDAFDRPRASGVFCFVCADGKPIAIEIPDIAESGNTVPFTITVDSPMVEENYVKALYVLATGNPQSGIANFYFSPLSGRAYVQSRMRLARTQEIIIVSEMSDNRFHLARRSVKVTIGGCGG